MNESQPSSAMLEALGARANRHVALIFGTAMFAIIAAYWPVRQAGFAWDDLTAFVENDWLVAGDHWRQYVLRDFHGWINYFRPLGVATFTLQARLFDSQPAPMHLVSLALHLIGTALVGAIVARCTRTLQMGSRVRLGWIGACMLLYGLHPAITESVAWISSQFELLLVAFCLSAVWATVAMPTGWARTGTIGVAFFLAACSKETAVVLPLLILLFDWALARRRDRDEDISIARRAFIRRNAGPAMAMLIAGLLYLWFRNFGLGHLLVSTPMYGGELSTIGNIQKIAWTWWSYLKLAVVPAPGLDAVHSFESDQFESVRPGLLVLAGASVTLIGWATYTTITRGAVAASLILAIFLALFPTLNILPAGYAISLYHDRYIALALAMCCVFLPLARWPQINLLRSRAILMLGSTVAIAWLVASLVTIRTTLPAWKDDESLWRATIVRNATNEIVQYNLVTALLRQGRIGEATAYLDRFVSLGAECTLCDIEVASFRLDQGDRALAISVIDRIARSERIRHDLDARAEYLLIAGQLALEQGQLELALRKLRAAIELQPDRSISYVLLAETLAQSGHASEARQIAEHTMRLGPANSWEALDSWRIKFIGRLNEAATAR